MKNLIPLSQARRNEFIVIIDNKENEPHFGITEVILKKAEEIKMMGVETTDRLFEALVDVFHEIENVEKNRKEPDWHIRLGNSCYEIFRATLPHVIGMTKSDISRKTSN